MTNEKEREDFEAWFAENFEPHEPATSYGYIVLEEVWQACAAKKDAEIAELQRKLAAYEAQQTKGWLCHKNNLSMCIALNYQKPSEHVIELIPRPSTTEHLDALLKAERERCAKVCDRHAENQARHGDAVAAEQSRQDAEAIRALD